MILLYFTPDTRTDSTVRRREPRDHVLYQYQEKAAPPVTTHCALGHSGIISANGSSVVTRIRGTSSPPDSTLGRRSGWRAPDISKFLILRSFQHDEVNHEWCVRSRNGGCTGGVIAASGTRSSPGIPQRSQTRNPSHLLPLGRLPRRTVCRDLPGSRRPQRT